MLLYSTVQWNFCKRLLLFTNVCLLLFWKAILDFQNPESFKSQFWQLTNLFIYSYVIIFCIYCSLFLFYSPLSVMQSGRRSLFIQQCLLGICCVPGTTIDINAIVRVNTERFGSFGMMTVGRKFDSSLVTLANFNNVRSKGTLSLRPKVSRQGHWHISDT